MTYTWVTKDNFYYTINKDGLQYLTLPDKFKIRAICTALNTAEYATVHRFDTRSYCTQCDLLVSPGDTLCRHCFYK